MKPSALPCAACGCTASLPAIVRNPGALPRAGRACTSCGALRASLVTPTRTDLRAPDARALVAAGLLARPTTGRYGLTLTSGW